MSNDANPEYRKADVASKKIFGGTVKIKVCKFSLKDMFVVTTVTVYS